MVKILLDTADIEEIERVKSYYPIDGITTNPSILKKYSENVGNILKKFEVYSKNGLEIHIQTTEETALEIVNEAKILKEIYGSKFHIKIPITKEGLIAVKMCREVGINVTVTAVFTQFQAIAAAKVGANYVAPYVNRMFNVGIDANETIDAIKRSLEAYSTEILAASFKNVNQLQDIVYIGAEAITVQPELLENSIWHPYTDKSLIDFDSDWNKEFGNNKIIDYIER